jgi:hypothetical protein
MCCAFYFHSSETVPWMCVSDPSSGTESKEGEVKRADRPIVVRGCQIHLNIILAPPHRPRGVLWLVPPLHTVVYSHLALSNH